MINNIINTIEDRYIVDNKLNIIHTLNTTDFTKTFNCKVISTLQEDILLENIPYTVIDNNTIEFDFSSFNITNGVYGLIFYYDDTLFGKLCVKKI